MLKKTTLMLLQASMIEQLVAQHVFEISDA